MPARSGSAHLWLVAAFIAAAACTLAAIPLTAATLALTTASHATADAELVLDAVFRVRPPQCGDVHHVCHHC